MKVIEIAFFAGFFLFTGLKPVNGSTVLADSAGLTESSTTPLVRESIVIPDLFFAGTKIDEQKLEQFEARLNKLYAKLKKKQERYNEQDFYEYIFYQVHRKLLKRYTHEAEFSDLVNDGAFNCLTGSLIYAHLLNALSIEHKILEYPFHVNILITEGNRRILLESTDALTGYMVKDEDIDTNINHYKYADREEIDVIPSVANSYRSVSFDELTGLLFFNKAVQLINKGKIEDAHLAVKQARAFYPSGRLNDLENYLASLW